MKVRASVKKMCRNCKIVRRKRGVRVICSDPTHKDTGVALPSIFGIGCTRARGICVAAGVPTETKVKDMTEAELDKIRLEVGKHTVEGDLRRQVSMNIKLLMGLGTDRGMRHPPGL